jgi:hypothetical protein
MGWQATFSVQRLDWPKASAGQTFLQKRRPDLTKRRVALFINMLNAVLTFKPCQPYCLVDILDKSFAFADANRSQFSLFASSSPFALQEVKENCDKLYRREAQRLSCDQCSTLRCESELSEQTCDDIARSTVKPLNYDFGQSR